MEREPDGTLITLQDEDGNEREFEHLASLEWNGSTYVALVPADLEPEELVESDAELVILKTVPDENGEDILSTIDDDAEYDSVAKEFESLLEDEYEIQDEEESVDTAGDDDPEE